MAVEEPSDTGIAMTRSHTVLVIGSNSFSGASFIDYALEQGARVLAVSRSAEPNRVFLPYRWSGHDANLQFFPYDLNHHLDEIMALVERERPSYVVNFAAQSMVAESWANPDHWFQTNVVSTIRLHERLRHCDFLDRYVHVTTPEVYGSTEGFIREDAPFNPSTPYAVSRAAADMSLKTFHEAYGFPVVSTRAANVYGPGQQLYRIIPRTMLFLRTDRKLELHGGGVSRRSFIHIRDVSEATWRIMLDGVSGQTYHISTNEIVTIRALVERICAKMGVDFAQHVEVAPERLGKDSAYQLDSGKLRQTLGWCDRIGLEQGLNECATWVDANLAELSRLPANYIHKP
jgi:dTDP-glucose 4,6-dehydratase